MKQVSLSIDDQAVTAPEGSRLLWAILEAGLWVPNLCAIQGVEPPRGGCRLCWVEVEGRDKPVASCATFVQEGMRVRTRSPAVDRLVAAGFEMLMSTHRLDCKACPGNHRCGLQEIANRRKLKLRPRRLPRIEPDWPIDDSRADLGLNPNHCILCGKCIHACADEAGRGILAFAHRGLATVVSTFDGEPLAAQGCSDCSRCAAVCPTGAIYQKQPAGAGRD